jgi:hypothetical protein
MPLREFMGCRERIARAEAHAKTFGNEWSQLIDEDFYNVTVKVEDDGRGGIWVWPHVTPLPSVFALELGECFYNLRSALDHCVYAAAIRETGKNPPPNENALEFPICETEEEFNKSRWKIQPLTDKRRLIIESVQPYKAPHLRPEVRIYSFNRSLWLLHSLAKKDRHRKLHVVGSWASSANPMLVVPDGTTVDYFSVSGSGFLEHEGKIASFHIDGWKPGMNVQANPNLAIDIALDEPPPPSADNDTLGNRIRGMIIAVTTITRAIEDSFLEPSPLGS